MTAEFPHIDRPSPVTDVPTIQHRPEVRRIQALWPLRKLHDERDGDGIEYAVLTVTHSTSRRAYGASLNREQHFSGTAQMKSFDAAPVGRLTSTGRFSQKGLHAAFTDALRTLREQLAAFFTPTGGGS